MYKFLPSEPLSEFELFTVTSGLSCSPYLALRALMELADREAKIFPEATEVIRKHVYVDDIVISV